MAYPYLTRRHFLAGCMASMLALGAAPRTAFSGAAKSADAKAPAGASHVPILMFHKVDDTPRYPEDISSDQLARLFDFLWQQGFCPVNISDIVTSRLDQVVPRGLKALGITADDAHRSLLFSKAHAAHPDQNNTASFVEIFAASLRGYATPPRATFFLGRVGNDRYKSSPEGYFGNLMPLREALDSIAHLPGIDFGYHTCAHRMMKSARPDEVAAMITEQMDDFRQNGVLDRISPLLAYPYGVPPSAEGVQALRRCGLQGAVLAFPGANELRTGKVPVCMYDDKLRTAPFFLPRQSIGAYTYAPLAAQETIRYIPIDPLDDFLKDVEQHDIWIKS